jgi:hypothetical protein
MARFKSIMKTVMLERAIRKRTCKHSASHHILGGELCFVVSEGDSRRYVYCMACAKTMVKEAAIEIGQLQRQLSPT